MEEVWKRMGKELSLSWRTVFSPGRAEMWIWISSSRKEKSFLLKEVPWPLNSQAGEQEQRCGVYCSLDILWLCLTRGWGTPYLWSPGRFWSEISAEIITVRPEIPHKPQGAKIEASPTLGNRNTKQNLNCDFKDSCLNPVFSILELLWVCIPIKFPVWNSCNLYVYAVGASVNQAHISLGKLSLFKKI